MSENHRRDPDEQNQQSSGSEPTHGSQYPQDEQHQDRKPPVRLKKINPTSPGTVSDSPVKSSSDGNRNVAHRQDLPTRHRTPSITLGTPNPATALSLHTSHSLNSRTTSRPTVPSTALPRPSHSCPHNSIPFRPVSISHRPLSRARNKPPCPHRSTWCGRIG